MKINIIQISKSTMADGPGLRDSVYCSGCYHHCPGCHNPETWPMSSGVSREVDEVAVELLKSKYNNITFTGGDPIYQAEAFAELATKIKSRSNKTIWLYTGFTIEKLVEMDNKNVNTLLELVDVIVDGPFILSLRDTSLKYRGSKNQRILYNNHDYTYRSDGGEIYNIINKKEE